MLYEKAIEAFGNIDVLINNAGEYYYSPIERVQDYDIERVMLLNLSIPYYLASLGPHTPAWSSFTFRLTSTYK